MSSSNEQNIPQLSTQSSVKAEALQVMSDLKAQIDLIRGQRSRLNHLIQTAPEPKPTFLMQVSMTNEARLRDARTNLNLWIQKLPSFYVVEEPQDKPEPEPKEATRQCLNCEDEIFGVQDWEDDLAEIAYCEFTHKHADLTERNRVEFDELLKEFDMYTPEEIFEDVVEAYRGQECELECRCVPGCLPNV